MRRIIANIATILLIVLLLTISIVVVIAIFGKVEAATRAQIFLEAAKVLLEFAIILILGGLATLAIRSFDKRRRGAKALQDFRQDFLNALSEAYQEAKRIRRRLRAVGLTTKHGDSEPRMNKSRCQAYQTEMLLLNDTQLSLERLKIEAGNFRDAFTAKDRLEADLGEMEGYLRGVVKEYEKHWGGLESDPPTVRFAELKELADFTGPSKHSKFRNDFSERYHVAVGLVRQDLLPIRYVHAE